MEGGTKLGFPLAVQLCHNCTVKDFRRERHLYSASLFTAVAITKWKRETTDAHFTHLYAKHKGVIQVNNLDQKSNFLTMYTHLLYCFAHYVMYLMRLDR